MKMLRILALGTLLGVMLTPGVQAQMELDVTPFAGGTFFLADPPEQFRLGHGGDALLLEDGRFTDSFTMGVDIGLVWNETWALEAMGSWIPTNLKARSGLSSTADVNAFMYGLTALYYLPLDGAVDPFFGLGVGGETFDYALAGVDTHHEWMGNVVAGIRFAVNDRFGLRLEARDCIARFDSGVSGVSDSWENDLMATIGMSFRTSLR
ncbi:MAG: porin family protein [Gemmatimonadota bacterium]|nr:porin family protein [Gemmatimonadota bacterium]MDH3424481.1 porin family protein [Gemmatimonadota bacterium]